MRYYWRLQHRMLNRHIIDFGLHPIVAYLLSILIFIGLSISLFSRTAYAAPIYGLIAVSLIQQLSETDRNDFLKNGFIRHQYYQIRLIENMLVAFPFLLFLICKRLFLPAALLFLVALFLVRLQFKNRFQFILPTPFYKRPFEFIIGFRNSFYVFLFAYILTGIAITVGNFNLGLFSLLLLFLVSLNFYTHPEPVFYVWIHAFNSKAFLLHKIKTALLFSTLLCIPVTFGLGIFFFQQLPVILGIQGLGYLYLVTMILAKYTVFPNPIHITHILLLVFSMLFPPVLLVTIPFFYVQSIKKINGILK